MASAAQGRYLPRRFSELPENVLEHVFSYLKVPQVLQARQVCSVWKAVIDNKQFWLQRIQKLGVKVKQEYLKITQLQIHGDDYLILLQSICLCEENVPSKRFYEKDWIIGEEDLLKATSYLAFSRAPDYLTLKLRSDLMDIQFLGIFMKLLSFNACRLSIKDIANWRGLSNSSSWLLEQLNACHRCEVYQLWTALTSFNHLPTTVTGLRLALVVDPITQALVDPGLRNIRRHCTGLKELGIHVPAGYSTAHLTPLPDLMFWPSLYLSRLASDEDVASAVAAAKQLQSPRGWRMLYLPMCALTAPQMEQLWQGLGDAQVKVRWEVNLSKRQYSDVEQRQLSDARRVAWPDCEGGLYWANDEENFYGW